MVQGSYGVLQDESSGMEPVEVVVQRDSFWKVIHYRTLLRSWSRAFQRLLPALLLGHRRRD